MPRSIWISRVVTKHIIGDTVAWLQNIFGARLKGYERMANKGFEEIQQELKEKYPSCKMLWHRYEITQLTDGALLIVFYGEADEV